MSDIDPTKTIKVWRGNRADQERDIPIGELFERFQASEWPKREDLAHESQVRMFLADTERVSYLTDDDETTSRLWDLIDLVREAAK